MVDVDLDVDPVDVVACRDVDSIFHVCAGSLPLTTPFS